MKPLTRATQWKQYSGKNIDREYAGLNRPKTLNITLPVKLQDLFRAYDYKFIYGGRGSAKTETVAAVLLLKARIEQATFLCARELQNSIADSVYATLESVARRIGIYDEFIFQKKEIIHRSTGSKFIFKGIRHNIEEIKSTHGVKYCWVEEAGKLSEHSLNVLLPTIRADGAEIFFTANPELESDPVYKMFVLDTPPPNSLVVKMNWNDNPWFPAVLDTQRRFMQQKDPELYDWVWNGNCRKASEYAIYARMVIQEPFDSPPMEVLENGSRVKYYFGGDFGFGSDPCAGIRGFICDKTLYLDHEVYQHDVDVDRITEFFRGLPGIEHYTSYFDSSRPELIKRLRRDGLDARPCTKFSGSIEAGIAYLKSFDKIVIHPRCVHAYEEFTTYKYKVKKNTLDTEYVEYTEPEDRFNHICDSTRYACDHEINAIGQVDVSTEFLNQYQSMMKARSRR